MAAPAAATASAPAASAAAAPSPPASAAAAGGAPRLAPSLAAVRLQSTFVDALPGDPITENYPRQVSRAAYSLVAPTDPTEDDVMVRVRLPPGEDPTAGGRIKTLPRGLLAWSPDVAAMLGVDPAAPPPAVGDPAFDALVGAATSVATGPPASGGGSDASADGNGGAAATTTPAGAAALLDGSVPYAACYGGHQFGSWAGQLGDGRAITLGEVVPPGGGRLEVQLKGAGRTPYSRSADGRAVLRSSVREFLASEAMAGLGVPTTRALALLSTGAGVLRDKFYDGNAAVEPGAVVARVTPSFLRLGSFELPASRGDVPLLKALADWAITHHFPHLAGASEAYAPDVDGDGDGDGDDDVDNKYGLLLREVIARNAAMVAHWQAVGFVHGVQNTDNYALTGVTLDYGPYGWLDTFDPAYTPNTTDLPGRRYCFGRQPAVAGWNLSQFASSFVPLVGVARARAALATYATAYATAWAGHAGAKLGLLTFDYTPGVVAGVVTETPPPPPTADEGLLVELLALMEESASDWTNTWRSLARVPSTVPDGTGDEADAALLAPLAAAVGADAPAALRSRWAAWVRRYAARVAEDGRPDAERRAAMDAANPAYVLRNYMAQVAIEQAEAGEFGELDRLRVLLASPYTEQAGAEGYTAPPPSWASRRGVCMNSCSS